MINYSISQNTTVNVSVYDIFGKEIDNILNKQQQFGSYSVSWDGSAFPSGIYFYKLQTNSKSITERMLIIR